MLVRRQSFRILPDDLSDRAARDEKFLRPVKAADKHLNVSCCPDGLCGRCRLMKRDYIQCETTDTISPYGYEGGYVRAWNSIDTSLEVEVLNESRLERDVLVSKSHDIPSWKTLISTNRKSLVADWSLNPTPREKYREMKSQAIEDHICEYPFIMNYFLSSLFLPPTQSLCLPVVTEFSEIEYRCKSATKMEDVR